MPVEGAEVALARGPRPASRAAVVGAVDVGGVVLVVVELDDLAGDVGLERAVVVGQVGKGVLRHGGPPLLGTMGTGCTLSGRSGPAHAVAPLPGGRRGEGAHGSGPMGACHAVPMVSEAPPADPALLDAGGGAHPQGGRGHARVVPLRAAPHRPQGRRHAGDRGRPRRRAAPPRGAGRALSPTTASSARRRPSRRDRRAGAGSSTRSTAPRRSPTACRCTPTCWRSRTSTASPSG